MNLQEQGTVLCRKMQILEGQKCKLIHSVWKIEAEQETIREKMRKIGFIPIFEIDEQSPEMNAKLTKI